MLHFQDPLSFLRQQASRLAAHAALDPARGQPAAVMWILSHMMGDRLGWTPATQVALPASAFPSGSVEAHGLSGFEHPDLLVAALDYPRPQDDDTRVAVARELGARWLIESNIVEWRVTDTRSAAPGFACRLEADEGMRLLLGALTYDDGTEQRLEQVAAIGEVLSFENRLMDHLLSHERGHLIDELMAMAAGDGVRRQPWSKKKNRESTD